MSGDEVLSWAGGLVIGIVITVAVLAPIVVVMLIGRVFIDLRARRRTLRLQRERDRLSKSGAARRGRST